MGRNYKYLNQIILFIFSIYIYTAVTFVKMFNAKITISINTKTQVLGNTKALC